MYFTAANFKDVEVLFQVRLHIFEARELYGSSLNPLLRVILDGRCRSSLSQHNTNSPRWDESLSFTIRKSLQDMMRTCLEFRVCVVTSCVFKIHQRENIHNILHILL